jgi:hypothetical protein
MTSRLASKTRLANWKPKPNQENLISPDTAIATLSVMMRMLMNAPIEGFATFQDQLVMSVTTGPAA